MNTSRYTIKVDKRVINMYIDRCEELELSGDDTLGALVSLYMSGIISTRICADSNIECGKRSPRSYSGIVDKYILKKFMDHCEINNMVQSHIMELVMYKFSMGCVDVRTVLAHTPIRTHRIRCRLNI